LIVHLQASYGPRSLVLPSPKLHCLPSAPKSRIASLCSSIPFRSIAQTLLLTVSSFALFHSSLIAAAGDTASAFNQRRPPHHAAGASPLPPRQLPRLAGGSADSSPHRLSALPTRPVALLTGSPRSPPDHAQSDAGMIHRRPLLTRRHWPGCCCYPTSPTPATFVS
jgi:hypothetical protein